jgi:hypothetical protein
MIDFREEGACREEITVHRRTNRLRPEAAGAGHAGRGDLSQDGHCPGHVLQLEEAVSGLGPSELRRLRQLEEENNRLKKLVADLSLDKVMLQDVVRRKI